MTRPENEISAHNKEQLKYYEERSLDENVRVLPSSLSRYISRHLEQTVRAGKFSPEERILDIGCGMGKYTIPLSMRGLNIEGLDLSPYLLEQLAAHNEGGRPIATYCTDLLEHIPELESKYDVVTGFFMLHHMIDLKATFEAASHYLKPGGRMVFLDVNALNPLYYLQITFTPTMSWRTEKGLLSLTKKNLIATARSAGFDGCSIERFGMFPPQLTNRPLGAMLEDALGCLPFIRPFSAFQILTARKS